MTNHEKLPPEVHQAILAASESIFSKWIVDFAKLDFDSDLSQEVDKVHTSQLCKCVDFFESQSEFLNALEEWIASPDYQKDLVDYKKKLDFYAKKVITKTVVVDFVDWLMKHLCK